MLICHGVPQDVSADLLRYGQSRYGECHSRICLYNAAHEHNLPDAEHYIALTDRKASIIIPQGHRVCPLPLRFSALDSLLADLFRSDCASLLPVAKGWDLDLANRVLRGQAGQSLTLTEKEVCLLEQLVHHTPALASRDFLLEAVWQYDSTIDTHTLETHIYRLRQKLEQTGAAELHLAITTEAGGYRWQPNKKHSHTH